MRILKFVVLLLILQPCLAQFSDDDFYYWLNHINRSNNEDIEQEWLLNYLQDLNRHPILLNGWSENKLRNCLVLSSKQSEEIILHRRKYGAFLSVYELRKLPSFHRDHLRHLIPYLSIVSSINHMSKAQIKMSTHHKIKKSGETNDFLGNLWKQQFKIQYTAPLFTAAYRAEKDEGESLFSHWKQPVDYASFYLLFPQLWNRIKLVLGDYQLQYGQGLTLYTQRNLNRNGAFASAKNVHMGLNPYRSFRENAALRGLAVQIQIGRAELELFYSKSLRDARIENNRYSSFSSDGGLHQKPSEQSKRNQLEDHQYGALWHWKLAELNLGIITSFRSFQFEAKANKLPYQLYNHTGRHIVKSGIFWDYFFNKFNCYGEISFTNFSKDQSYSTGLLWNPLRQIDLGVHLTSIARDHFINQSEPLHVKSNFRGERNLKFNVVYEERHWNISASLQRFQMSWLSANLNNLDYGTRHSIDFNHRNRANQLRIQWSHRTQQIETNQTFKRMSAIQNHKVRLRYEHGLIRSLRFRTYLEINQRLQKKGYLVYQELKWQGLHHRLRFTTRISSFHIPTSEQAVYFYEAVAIGQNPWNAEFKSGTSWMLLSHYKINKRITLDLKYKIQNYPLRQHYYLDLAQIESASVVNRKNTFAIQLTYISD